MLNKHNFTSLGKVYFKLNKTSRSAIFAALNLWVIKLLCRKTSQQAILNSGLNKADVYNSLAIIFLRKKKNFSKTKVARIINNGSL